MLLAVQSCVGYLKASVDVFGFRSRDCTADGFESWAPIYNITAGADSGASFIAA